MTDFIPRFKIYNEAGDTLLYTFELVQDTNHPQSPMRYIEVEGVRGIGSLIIPAGIPAWDLTIRGILMIDGASEGYEELVTKMDALESAIALNTNYELRIDKSISQYYSYHVRRILSIEYSASMLTAMQEYVVTFRTNLW